MRQFKHIIGKGLYIMPDDRVYVQPGDVREYILDVHRDPELEMKSIDRIARTGDMYCPYCNRDSNLLYQARANLLEMGFCSSCKYYFEERAKSREVYLERWPDISLEYMMQLIEWGYELSTTQYQQILAEYKRMKSLHEGAFE